MCRRKWSASENFAPFLIPLNAELGLEALETRSGINLAPKWFMGSIKFSPRLFVSSLIYYKGGRSRGEKTGLGRTGRPEGCRKFGATLSRTTTMKPIHIHTYIHIRTYTSIVHTWPEGGEQLIETSSFSRRGCWRQTNGDKRRNSFVHYVCTYMGSFRKHAEIHTQ